MGGRFSCFVSLISVRSCHVSMPQLPTEKKRNKDTETLTEAFRNLLMGKLFIVTYAISPTRPGRDLLNWSKRQRKG